MNRRSPQLRRGTILITTIWIIIILAGLVLVFSRSMRTEVVVSANRQSYEQASAIERGAEQYVLSQVDGSQGNAANVTSAPAQALPLGTGYFWIIRPYPTNPQIMDYGIVDESSKLNINTAADQEIALLPNMTQDVADSIVDWRDADSNVTGQGAETSYYQGLPEPYQCKNSNFETVEELRLVKIAAVSNVNPSAAWDQMLFGYDFNHNGVIDQAELNSGGLTVAFNSGNGSGLGIFPFVTVYTNEPNTDSTGAQRVNVNQGLSGGNVVVTSGRTTGAQPAPAGNNNPGQVNQALQKALSGVLSGTRLQQVLQKAQSSGPYANSFDFAQKVGLTQQEVGPVLDKITTSAAKALPGLVNVNTAPREVLQCLGGLSQSDVDALLAQRQTADTSNAGWVLQALQPQKLAAVGGRLTSRSFQYSADIVAVSGDGRAFCRARIVVDCSGTMPKIIYRKDLTALGWPLTQDILATLRSGRQLPLQTTPGVPQGSMTTGF